MDSYIFALAEESINLELNVSDIYSLFTKLFPDDAPFWWKLVVEEKNHAALIRSGIEIFEPIGAFPHEIVHDNLQNIIDINQKLRLLLLQLKKTPPSREEAFNIALQLENSAGEVHFQYFLEKESKSSIEKIIKNLSREDKDHAERIFTYMLDNDISVQPNKKT